MKTSVLLDIDITGITTINHTYSFDYIIEVQNKKSRMSIKQVGHYSGVHDSLHGHNLKNTLVNGLALKLLIDGMSII